MKLGDFGEAKQLGKDGWTNTINMGTSEYRAPEVYGGDAMATKGYNDKADSKRMEKYILKKKK